MFKKLAEYIASLVWAEFQRLIEGEFAKIDPPVPPPPAAPPVDPPVEG